MLRTSDHVVSNTNQYIYKTIPDCKAQESKGNRRWKDFKSQSNRVWHEVVFPGNVREATSMTSYQHGCLNKNYKKKTDVEAESLMGQGN